MNEYDTASCLLNLIKKHYTQELRSHAIRILGSVDFLGNPLGLMVDFKVVNEINYRLPTKIENKENIAKNREYTIKFGQR